MTTENTTETASASPDNSGRYQRNGEARGSDVYQIVTDQIIQLLEAGVVPWRKPWTSDDRLPMNLISGKPYRGVNVFLLHVRGFGSPYWLTFNQAKQLGGNIRKGEKSSLAVFYKTWETTDKTTGEVKRLPVLRYYRVFNVEQCEGIDYPKPDARPVSFSPIEACEKIVANMPKPPVIQHGEARAYYRHSADLVNMPPRETFAIVPEYYNTLFHELAHATGHESRLDRLQKRQSNFGDTSYAREELIAEMTASFLCGQAGIERETLDNSASYIANWLERLVCRRLLIRELKAAKRLRKLRQWLRRVEKVTETPPNAFEIVESDDLQMFDAEFLPDYAFRFQSWHDAKRRLDNFKPRSWRSKGLEQHTKAANIAKARLDETLGATALISGIH